MNGPSRNANGLLTLVRTLIRFVLSFVFWAILLVFAAIVLVPMLLMAGKAPPTLVLPTNETREQIYNLACSKGLSGGSHAERELISRRRSLVEMRHPIRVVRSLTRFFARLKFIRWTTYTRLILPDTFWAWPAMTDLGAEVRRRAWRHLRVWS